MSHNVDAKEFHPWLKGHESTLLQKLPYWWKLTFTPNLGMSIVHTAYGTLKIFQLLDEIIYWCQTFEKFQDGIGSKMPIFVHVWSKNFHVEVDR